MNLTIDEIMTNEVIWINPNETLFDALQIMRKFDIRHLPVVEEGTSKLIGLLSEGDIILHCQKKGQRLEVNSKILVEDAMTNDVVFCYPSSNTANVAATMITAKIDSMPILKGKNKELIGIVTTTDLLDQLCINEELNGQDVRPLKFSKKNTRQDLDIQKSS